MKTTINLYSTLLYSLLFLTANTCSAQSPKRDGAVCINEDFDRRVDQLLDYTTPVIDIKTLHKWMNNEDFILLDIREEEEYEISHIPGAVFLGYKSIDEKLLQTIPLNKKIVVYCSVGYRSEKIGTKLLKRGFSNVFNLYGSIFEWVNRSHPLEDINGNVTQKIHTYNKKWSKWVDNSEAIKVW